MSTNYKDNAVFILLNVNKNDCGYNTDKKKTKGKFYVTSKLSRFLFYELNTLYNLICLPQNNKTF